MIHHQPQDQVKQRIMIPKNLINQLAACNNGKSITAQINELIINHIAQDVAHVESNTK